MSRRKEGSEAGCRARWCKSYQFSYLVFESCLFVIDVPLHARYDVLRGSKDRPSTLSGDVSSLSGPKPRRIDRPCLHALPFD